MLQSSHGFMRNNYLLYLIVLYLCSLLHQVSAVSPTFLTSLPDCKAGSVVLILAAPSTANGYDTTSTQFNFPSSFSQAPNMALGLSFLSSSYSTTTNLYSWAYELSVTGTSQTNALIQLVCTTGIVSQMSVNYLAVLSTSFLEVTYAKLDLTSFTIYTQTVPQSRSVARTIPYRTKSNSTNAVIAVSTVGMNSIRQSVHTFIYSLSISAQYVNSYEVTLTAGPYNRLSSVTVQGISYESVATTIYPPYYLSIGYVSDFSGTIPENSGATGVTAMGIIFIGMTDWTIDDSNGVNTFNLSVSQNTYTLTSTSLTSCRNSYVWYRQESCTQYYYLSAHVCYPCDISCSTCSGPSNTSCLSCTSTRSYSLATGSCPCLTGYVDQGARQCTAVSCNNDLCKTCAYIDQCGSCYSFLFRELNGTQCVCMKYRYDHYLLDGSPYCDSCHYSCYTCVNASPTSCLSCNTARDNREFKSSNSTCACIARYYDSNTTICSRCQYTCSTCTLSTYCTSCNSTRGRVLDATSTYCMCSAGLYDDRLQEQCQSCMYTCTTCSDATTCTTCPSTRELTNTSSANYQCTCMAGYYDNGVSAQCLNCQYTCSTCVAIGFCDSCSISMHRQFNATTKFCTCSTGYYDDNINQLCATCNIMCKGCVGPTLLNCTSCDSAAFRALSLTGECLCMDGYYQYDNFTKTCATCFYTCSKCVNGAACTACNNLKFRAADAIDPSKCVCMAGYFDTGNQLCTSCPYYCVTCTNSTSCLTCDSTRNLTVNCSCVAGFYDDGASRSCQPCLSECVTCANANNCTSCTSVIRYLTSAARCKCSSGYYEPSCLACTYQCLQCTGVADNCVTCNGLAYRYFMLNNATGKGECLCYQGYYSDNVNNLCKPCHYSCLNCTDSTACLSCPVNRIFDMSNQYCVCTSQFYQNNQSLNCLPCHYSCSACSDYSVCTQCNPAKFRLLNAITRLCACSPGYYDDGLSQLCYSCAPECTTCSSYISCLSCDLSTLHRVLAGSTNRCICTQSYYQSTADYFCHLCQYSCLTCVDGLSCLSCVAGRVFDVVSGLCKCRDGTFQNGTTYLCDSCVYPCATCVSTSSTCKSCETSHLFLASSSSCYCPTGTYQNTTKCASCLPTCQACITNLSCGSCRPSDNRQLTMVSGANQCTCLTGFQDQNGVNIVCATCHYSCNTCLNLASCLTCKDIRVMLNGTNNLCTCPALRYFDDGANAACLPCSYLCLSCNQLSTNCTTCSASAFRYLYSTDNTTNSSTCVCLNKYFSAGGSIEACSACQYSCSTCTGSSSCQTCNATLFRVLDAGSTPYCACSTGFYDVTNSQLCLACSYTCLTCSQTSSFCLSCVATRTLLSNACNCNSGLFDDGTNSNPVCQSCLYMCSTCSNSSTCLTCPSTRSLNSSSLCACLTGYYDTGINKQCVQCHPSCKQCSGYSTCTLCFDSTQLRVLYNSACICPVGYYDDTLAHPGSTNYTCQLCHHSCLRCQNSLSCSSCDSTMLRTRDINTGLCKCVDGYYDDGINQLCLACSFDCLTCADGTSCLTCPTQRYLDSTAPQRCLCSSTYYTNNTVCQSCPSECATCTSYTQCTACNNPTQRVLTSGACLCNMTLFPVANSASCSACHYSCSSCTSYPYCSTCSTVAHRYLSSRQCKCLPSFYDDLTAELCQPCQYSCLTCTNSSECLTCDTSSVANRIFDSFTKFCKCNIGFYEDATLKTCLSCNYSCYTCTNPNSCSACSPTSMRTLDPTSSLCLCPVVGYFDQSLAPVCAACSPTCYKCASSSSFCTDCNSNVTFRTLVSNNTCVCMDGYFTSSSTVTCAACSYKCLTCDTLSTQCSSCAISNNRDNTTLPVCSCLQGFYDDGSSPQCLICDYRCLTCLDGFKCATCDAVNSHRTLNLISEMCQCDNHYYEPVSSSSSRDPVCLACHYSCLTCNHATLCLTCDMTNNTRVFNNGQCDCVPGYYDNGISSVCGLCSYVCLTCVASLSCQTCDPLKNRVYNLTSTTCECPLGYYDIGNGVDSMCYQCQSSCYTCTNSTACQTCKPLVNKYINSTQGTNFCICLYGYYQVVSTGVCHPCHYSCQRCSGSSTACTVCDASAHRYLSSGSCLCSTSYFDDGRNEACLLCTTNCSSCFGTNAGQCLVCINGTYLLNGNCLASCPDFYYPVFGPWICSSCSSYCRNCTNSTVCLQCQSGFWLIPASISSPSSNSSNIICTNQCPQFYYHDSTTCLQCISPCYHCSAKFVCVDCIQMYFIDNSTGACYPCHPTCRYCTSSSVLGCISCVDGYFYNATLRLCVKMSCTGTQYVNSVYGCYNCKDTYANSLQCNANQVTKCMDGYQIRANPITAVLECIRCDRIPGFTFVLYTGLCQQICGDGIRYSAACDDGNLENGDGCSSICSIQPNWDCASPGNSSSSCTISSSFTPIITADSVIKVPQSNRILVVLSLNIGIRLVKQNFHLKFGSNQKFQFWCTPANTKYTKFNLEIEYFQSIAKDKLSVAVVSPASTQSPTHNTRLLQSTASLSISLELSLDVDVLTEPLALYYPAQQRTTYSNIIYIIVIVLHAVTLLTAAYFVLYLRLKNMLFVIELCNFLTWLYIYSTYGLFKVSELSPDAARGLQFFIYKFGEELPAQYAGVKTSAGYFGFGSFIISGCIIQLLILIVCIAIKTYYGGTSSTASRTQQQQRSIKYNAFRYYHLAFVYAFLPDLLLCCAIVFKWTEISSSVQSSYSWGIAIVVLVMIAIANVMYVIFVNPYARIIEKRARKSMIYPFNYLTSKQNNQLKQPLPQQQSIKKNITSNFVTIEQAVQKNSNIQEEQKYQNIYNDLFDPFNDEQPPQKSQSMSEKSHHSKNSIIRGRTEKIQDENRTQAIIINAEKRSVRSEKSSRKTSFNKYKKEDQISERSSKSKSTTVSQIERDGLIPLFDMNPCEISESSVADSNISYHKHILSQSYLPFKCMFVSLAICIVSQVQQPIPRCSLLIFCQLVTFIYLLFTMRFRNARTLKLIIMSLTLMGIAVCGLASALITYLNSASVFTGSNKSTITNQLYVIEAVEISLILFAIVWNLAFYLLQQLKSGQYRQYRMQQKNIEAIEKNKRRNRLRHIDSQKQDRVQVNNDLVSNNVFSKMRNKHSLDYEDERIDTKQHLRFDSETNTPAEYHNQHTNSNILLGLTQQRPSRQKNLGGIIGIEDIDDVEQESSTNNKIRLNKKLKSVIDQSKASVQKKTLPTKNKLQSKERQKQLFLNSLQQLQLNMQPKVNNNLKSTRVDESRVIKPVSNTLKKQRVGKQSRLDLISRNDFMAMLESELAGQDYIQNTVIEKKQKNQEIDKDNTLISYKESEDGNKRKTSTQVQQIQSKIRQSKNQLADLQNKGKNEQGQMSSSPNKVKQRGSFSIIKDLVPTRQHDEDPNIDTGDIKDQPQVRNSSQQSPIKYRKQIKKNVQNQLEQKNQEQLNSSQDKQQNSEADQEIDQGIEQQLQQIEQQGEQKQKAIKHYMYAIKGTSAKSKQKGKSTQKPNKTQTKKPQSNRSNNPSKQKEKKSKKIKRAHTNPYDIVKSYNQAGNSEDQQQYQKQEEIEPKLIKKAKTHTLPLDLPKGIKDDGFEKNQQINPVVQQNKKPKETKTKNKIVNLKRIDSISSISEDLNQDPAGRNERGFVESDEDENESEGVTVFKKILQDYQVYKNKRVRGNPLKRKQ